MSNSSELEGSSSNSLDIETSPNESSFTLLFYDDSRSDFIVSYVLVPFVGGRDSPFPVMASAEVEVSTLNKEEALPFIRTYLSTFGQRDAEFRDHLNLRTQSIGVDWLSSLKYLLE